MLRNDSLGRRQWKYRNDERCERWITRLQVDVEPDRLVTAGHVRCRMRPTMIKRRPRHGTVDLNHKTPSRRWVR